MSFMQACLLFASLSVVYFMQFFFCRLCLRQSLLLLAALFLFLFLSCLLGRRGLEIFWIRWLWLEVGGFCRLVCVVVVLHFLVVRLGRMSLLVSLMMLNCNSWFWGFELFLLLFVGDGYLFLVNVLLIYIHIYFGCIFILENFKYFHHVILTIRS